MADRSFLADPISESYQQIPEDLFVLVRQGDVDHQQFFILAVFHKETDYKKRGSIPLSLEIISERTKIPMRTLIRRLSDLVKRKLLLRRPSAIKGAKGYPVTEYVVNWPLVHELAGPIRVMPKPVPTEMLQGPPAAPPWRKCPNCRQWVSPLTKMASGQDQQPRPMKAEWASPAAPPEDVHGWDKLTWGMLLAEVREMYGNRVVEHHRPPTARTDGQVRMEIKDAAIWRLNVRVEIYAPYSTDRVESVLLWLDAMDANVKRNMVFGMMKLHLQRLYGPPRQESDVVRRGGRRRQLTWTFPSTTIVLAWHEGTNASGYVGAKFAAVEKPEQPETAAAVEKREETEKREDVDVDVREEEPAF